MRVVGLDQYGGPEQLKLFDLPDPTPKVEEVRVRVLCAGVNPVGVMVHDGSHRALSEAASRPLVPGMDICGTIDRLGEAVAPTFGLQPGQSVVGLLQFWIVRRL